jgi:hypothetical protein
MELMDAYRCREGSYLLFPRASTIPVSDDDGDPQYLGVVSCDLADTRICAEIARQLAERRMARLTREQFYSPGMRWWR